MPHADFVHLRVHSAYSLSSGAIRVKELAALAKKHGMPAVAATDAGNLFGALEFALAARDAGVQPIIGCELALRRGDGDGRIAGRIGPAAVPDPVVLLVQNEAGYRNLLKLVSRSFLETEGGEEPQVALAALDGASDGLLLLTGGPRGPVGRMLGEGQDAAAEAMLLRLAALFPGRLYVELMRHNLAAEDRIEGPLVDLAYKHGLPLVATNDVFFAGPDFYDAHDALLCIAEGTVLSNPNRRRLTPEHHFKSPEAMRRLFADLPEACDNTLAIALRCAYMPEPRAPILPPFATASGRSEEEELRADAEAGLAHRLVQQVFRPEMGEAARTAAAKPYRERLAFELDMIVRMGFAGYFLIVAEFIRWAKGAGIPVGPGRGSGAGSVAAWALTITDLDPLRFGLLFERFLNPERVSMPDFDIDFCQDRRDEVIRHVQERYGRDRVAQIITFGKLQARAVLRDVGRVLEMPYGQVDRICKLVPNNPAAPVTLQQAIDGEPMLQGMIAADEAVQRLVEIAKKLEGLYRHASTHAAGVVIGDRPLDELIPLYRDPRSDMPVTQFNMKYVELAGLVKFDFLGLKTLTVLARAARSAEAARHRARSRQPAARRPRDLRADGPRRHGRRVPARRRGHARHAAQAPPGPVRGHHRRRRALPPRPDGEHSALYQRQARDGGRRLSPSDPEADPGRNPRHHDLPGAGDADRAGAERLLARRRRPAAPRHGQEDQVRDGRAAARLHRRRRRARRRWRTSPSMCSSRSRNSPATASTSRTPPPTRSSPTRPPISRPITRSSSWRR